MVAYSLCNITKSSQKLFISEIKPTKPFSIPHSGKYVPFASQTPAIALAIAKTTSLSSATNHILSRHVLYMLNVNQLMKNIAAAVTTAITLTLQVCIDHSNRIKTNKTQRQWSKKHIHISKINTIWSHMHAYQRYVHVSTIDSVMYTMGIISGDRINIRFWTRT